jgi:hypothetical protein
VDVTTAQRTIAKKDLDHRRVTRLGDFRRKTVSNRFCRRAAPKQHIGLAGRALDPPPLGDGRHRNHLFQLGLF